MQRSPAAPLATLATHRPVAFAGVASLFAIWRQRRALARLDATARRDIGLTEGEAYMEATRPLWDVPTHWTV